MYQILEDNPIEEPPMAVNDVPAAEIIEPMVIEGASIVENAAEQIQPEGEEIPVPPVANEPAEQAPEEPAPIQREILAMLQLPQTFLRDVGLDEEFFDSLPEDLQQEQLQPYINQYRSNQRQNGGNNAQNPN